MKTIRLTMAQALVRFLVNQRIKIDGQEQPLFPGVFAIFGHGNVTCLGEALETVRDVMPTWRGQNEQSMALAGVAYAKAKRRRQIMVATSSIGPGCTNLLTAAAKTKKIINVKKGQFLSPYEIPNIYKKIESAGNNNIMITERGTSFGYNNLINDFKALDIMKNYSYPVIFDATHSVQEPGGLGEKSGGNRDFVSTLSKAAAAIGVAGIFIETHNDPDNAPSDGPNMLHLQNLENLLSKLIEFDNISKK